jgi:kinetochore protein Spc7/SPC105
VTGIVGTTVSMTYQREIELVFDMTSFQRNSKNSQIDLWYIANNRERDPLPSTPEKEFFLQCIRDQVRGLTQSRTKIADLLHMVRAAWDKANSTSNDIRLLNITFPTTVEKTSDSSVTIRSTLLIAPIETKVEVFLGLRGFSTPKGLEFAIQPDARVIYGEHFNVGKMAEFLKTHMGDNVVCRDSDSPPWSDVFVDLHERLLARGRK